MSETVKATFYGILAGGLLQSLVLAYYLGGLRKTVDAHSRLLELLPCLKPHCPGENHAEEKKS
jgi:hypothetical protein